MAGIKKIDKNCEDCGTLMVQVSFTKKLCSACAKERQRTWQRAWQKTYKAAIRKEKAVLRSTSIQNPNAQYCEGCIYWGGDYQTNRSCNYIFQTGHRRPCPPGKDCTVKIIGKRK